MAKKILVVEDDRPTYDALEIKLKDENFNIYHAKNGSEGLRIAKEIHPDLILLDIVMPVMDGVTMLKELRKDDWGRTVNVMMLTNLSDSEEIMKTQKNDVFDYLVKSDWKLEDILKKIKEKIGS